MSVQLLWFEKTHTTCDSCACYLQEGFKMWVGNARVPRYLCLECVDDLLKECEDALSDEITKGETI